MTLVYISFATDVGFLGGTVVEAMNAADAIAEATRLSLNPGGQAAIIQVPLEAEDYPDIKRMRNRLCGREEMLSNGGKRFGDIPEATQDTPAAGVTIVCEQCNESE
jgi:hypothetical protein